MLSDSTIRTVVYATLLRVVAVFLALVSHLSPLVLFGLFLFSGTPPTNPLRLIRVFAGTCFLPFVALWSLRWAYAARIAVREAVDSRPSQIVLQRHDRNVAIPVDRIESVALWSVPLPGPGIDLRVKDDRSVRYGLELANPEKFTERLSGVRGSSQISLGGEGARFAFWSARWAVVSHSIRRLLIKFPIFALVPTLPLFRVHQLIAYGGMLGEYYQYGLKAYLLAFAIYWATLTIYLVIYAAVLRVPIEVVCAIVAIVAPSSAARAREITEIAGRWLFYVSVPVFVVLRFIPW